MQAFWVSVASLILALVGGKDISKRLIGGIPTDPGEFPWMVRLVSAESECGAVMIHPRVVLTAAHCICKERDDQCVGIDGEIFTLWIGGRRIDGKDALHKIVVYPQNINVLGRNPDLGDEDFAVITLNDQDNDTLICATSTISLPNASPKMDEREEECYTIGWGFSGNCLSKPPACYDACGGNEGALNSDDCMDLGCCHYEGETIEDNICYYHEGQCNGISHQPCSYLDNITVTEAECHEYGCCYNKSSGKIGECYENSYMENESKKVLEKVDGYGKVDEYGWINIDNPDPERPKGTCSGDSGGPYVCRTFGTKMWKLYGIVASGINCGIDSYYWNVFNSLEFIMSVVPKDVAEDLRNKAGLPL